MAKSRKKPENKTQQTVSADDKSTKPKSSLRERNKKVAESKNKPKRIRKAAAQAKKPISGVGKVLTTEFHVLPRGSGENFFTKSRKPTPKYFSDSIAELRYVSWPGRRETWKLVFAVFVFALTLGSFIALLDFGLEQIFKKVIL